jgi:hypothetical protein
MFESPNKSDVVRSLSAVSRNAVQAALNEGAKVEKSYGPVNSELIWYVGQAVDEVHVRWLREAMSILAGYLSKVETTAREMTEWAKPELEMMADMIVGDIRSQDLSNLAKAARRHYKTIFFRRIEDALREFQLGRIDGEAIKVEASPTASTARKPAPTASPYVSDKRLNALRAIRSSQFDLTKLIRLCEELNSNYSAGNYYSVAMLVRAILDHVPPIFSATKFEDVRAKHGRQSFKEQMDHLEKSSRKMADDFLHGQVRRKEVLPTDTLIHFAPALDTLLGEVEVKLH